MTYQGRFCFIQSKPTTSALNCSSKLRHWWRSNPSRRSRCLDPTTMAIWSLISLRSWALYTPQQNGVADHANQTIVKMARSILHVQNLNLELWTESVVNVVYTCNWCPISVVENMTPKQARSGRQPCVANMRIYGCMAFANVPDARSTKLEEKVKMCVFFGYCKGIKAYRLKLVNTKKINWLCDVTFCDNSTIVLIWRNFQIADVKSL